MPFLDVFYPRSDSDRSVKSHKTLTIIVLWAFSLQEANTRFLVHLLGV